MHFHRNVLAAVAALAIASLAACAAPAPAPAPAATSTAAPATVQPTAGQQDFERLERTFGARLGVYAVDTGTGREVAFRADERFAYASTHKVFSAGAILRRTPVEGLDRTVMFGQGDVVSYSPITQKYAGTGMPLRAVLDAALRYSDNTAANLMFRELGGPAGLTAALRAIGDATTSPDRIEPALNEAVPGDPRDTSTPRAMAASLRAFTLGTALPEDRRAVLVAMMRANTTGATLVRAGVPADWQVADKTGAASYGTRDDIAVVWPPQRAPIVLVVLSDRQAKDAAYDDKLIAQAATSTVAALR
ncbi:class A beta-lactamase [Amycolatopsis cynarae]|uniref:Beta-lactamase n=1 Tax=Amycolatopsis cynarae TaxID=2995223 RepID=A0ABY7BEI1_9PSEU|nr:class A beta-lactamase [Amycolatopsis sp. HUAS 11-8]WAL69834.1 class A beta-lactamase [Amycolatopsis sp. HUAS 11-8]